MTSNNKGSVDIKDQLIDLGFLSITLKYPNYTEPFQFSLADKTLCSILDSGVLVIEPETSESNKNIVLSSGIHGNETAPIEMIDCIVKLIINGDLSVKNRILFIIGNPLAATQHKRFIDQNLNRLFSFEGRDSSSVEAKRAIRLMDCIETFFNADPENNSNKKIHYDLHTAIRSSLYPQFVIYPFQDDEVFDFSALSFFKRSKIETILLSHQPSRTFSYFTSHNYKAQAFTVELGSVKPFGENIQEDFEEIYEELINLIVNNNQNDDEYDSADDYRVFKVKHELIKKSEKFKLNLDSEVHNFHQFKAGVVVTNDIDGGYVTVENDAIIFPNANVPIGERTGLIISQQK